MKRKFYMILTVIFVTIILLGLSIYSFIVNGFDGVDMPLYVLTTLLLVISVFLIKYYYDEVHNVKIKDNTVNFYNKILYNDEDKTLLYVRKNRKIKISDIKRVSLIVDNEVLHSSNEKDCGIEFNNQKFSRRQIRFRKKAFISFETLEIVNGLLLVKVNEIFGHEIYKSLELILKKYKEGQDGL